MKKSFYFLAVSIFALCTMFSCASKDTPSEVIPSDVAMVVKFDIKRLALKADYKTENNKMLRDYIDKIDNSELKELVKSCLKNPNAIGLKVLGKAYLFCNNDGTIGISMAVDNSKKFYENLIKIEASAKENIKVDGGVYSMVYPSSSVSMAWDSKNIVIIVDPQNQQGQTSAKDISDMLKMEHDKSFAATPNYTKLSASDDDIVAYISMGKLSKFYIDQLKRTSSHLAMDSVSKDVIDSDLQSVYDDNNYSTIVSCNFENGKIISKMNIFFETPEDEARFNSMAANKTVLKGNLNKYVGENNIMYFAANIDGNAVASSIDSNKMNILNKLAPVLGNLDYKKLISVFNGDIFATFNRLNISSVNNPLVFSIFATVDKTKAAEFFEFILAKDREKKINKIADNTYTFNGIFFGIKDDIFYYTNDSIDYARLLQGGVENRSLSNIVGQPLYFGGSFVPLKEQLMPLVPQGSPFYDVAQYALGMISTFSSNATDRYNYTFEVNFTDTKTNSLHQIITLIDKVIGVII